MQRRRFITTVAGGAIGAWSGLQFARSGLAANPPGKLERVGLQLYTVRDQMKADFDGTLARIAAIGYKEVEFAGYYDRTPEQVKNSLVVFGIDTPAIIGNVDDDETELVAALDQNVARYVRLEIFESVINQVRKDLFQCKAIADDVRQRFDANSSVCLRSLMRH